MAEDIAVDKLWPEYIRNENLLKAMGRNLSYTEIKLRPSVTKSLKESVSFPEKQLNFVVYS